MNTRTYTDPVVLSEGVTAGWAEPAADATDVSDWPERQAQAWIPFEVTGGRPLNPDAPVSTGIRYGRNGMGWWGENKCGDAFVTVTRAGIRYLLMIWREDERGCALPGGGADRGETGEAAALRELEEEAGLILPSGTWRVCPPVPVPEDDHASDEAWPVTTLILAHLGEVGMLPALKAGDDAGRAEWVPANGYDTLETALRIDYGGAVVFPAHRQIIRQALEGAL